MSTATVADLVEDRDDEAPAEAKAPRSSKIFLEMISDAERVFRTYQDKCNNIEKLFANLELLSKEHRDPEFQLFWANVGVLGPSIYSRAPVPVVVPRFKDRRAVPRAAAELLERSTIVGFANQDIDYTMRLVRDDLTRLSRGVTWCNYEAEGKGKDFRQKVCPDHLHRTDFLHEPARNWKEVGWVAKRTHHTRSEMRKRFHKISGDAYKTAVYSVRVDDKDTDDGKQKAGVWEIWHKRLKKVVWVADRCEVVLDEDKPHLELEDFFPCPRPAYGTVQPGTLIPVPDVLFYKDQLDEINELTARIAALSSSLKVRGFYPAGAGDLGDAIEAAVKMTDDGRVLIGIANWAAVGGGTAKDTIVWLPTDQIAKTLTECVSMRKELFDDVYQIIGLSDIMRGLSQASETLGAQQLKSEYGSVRIRDRRDEMVRVARDITRISGEIQAENFLQKTLLEMSQLELPTDAEIAAQVRPLEAQILQITSTVEKAKQDPQAKAAASQNPQQAQQMLAQAKEQAMGLKGQIDKLKKVATIDQVMKLLREQRLRPYVLDIETDSTIAPDENAQKQRATEFMTAFGGVLEKAMTFVQTAPQAGPLVAEMLKFASSQFRAGRQLENAIDEFADGLAMAASQPKPPDPKQAEAAAKAEQQQQKAKTDAETAASKNAERMAKAKQTEAAAAAKALEAQTAAANAETDRSIKKQQQDDASAAAAVERDNKIRLTDRQIELLGVKHVQDMDKGSLEIELLNTKINQAEVATANSIATTDAGVAASAAKSAPKPGDQPGA